jgi:hypothetical protein
VLKSRFPNPTSTILMPLLAIVLCLNLLLSWSTITTVVEASGPSYSGGSGTAGSPYIISTEADLASVAVVYLNASSTVPVYYYSLSNDITLTATNFAPIGVMSTGTGQPFNGHFNGNGHTVSNLRITGFNSYVGLFGYTSGSVIADLGLPNVSVSGNNSVGGLIGLTSNSAGNTVTNCYATGLVSGNTSVGGLIGYNQSGGTNAVTTCYFSGTVSSSVTGNTSGRYIGGLAGQVEGGTYSNCFAAANVTGNQYVGGLLGKISNLNLSYSYATGNVNGNGTADQFLGGLIGLGAVTGAGPAIQYCHATGNVAGTATSTRVGGLVGQLSGYNISVPYEINHCYAAGNVTGGTPPANDGYTGGCFGNTKWCSVTYCYATGSVTGGVPGSTLTFAGGLMGISDNDQKIEYCWSTSNVSEGSQVGGLIGYADNDYDLKYCFATGAVNGVSNGVSAGGLIGNAYDTDVLNCYATGNTVNAISVGGLIGRTHKDNGAVHGSVTNCYTPTNSLIGTNEVSPVNITNCFYGPAATHNAADYTSWNFSGVWSTNGNTAYPFFRGLMTVEPNGGYYLTSQTVIINSQLDSSETIHYTTNGNVPATDDSSLTRADLPKSLSISNSQNSETIQARVYDQGASPQWYDLNTCIFTFQSVPSSSTYAITANIVPSAAQTAGCGVTGSGSYAAGATVNLQANTVSGWNFGNWRSSDIIIPNSTTGTLTFSMPARPVTVTATFSQAVLASTSTTVTSDINPSTSGQTVSFSATISFSGGTNPTGTVTFKDGTSTLGTGTPGSSGVATYSTSALAAGSHTMTAVYGGDSNFNGSTSPTYTQTVNAAAGGPTGGGGGGGGSPPPGSVTGVGSINVGSIVGTTGAFSQSATLVSSDGMATVSVPKGTTGTINGLSFSIMTLTPQSAPPSPPTNSNIVGVAYDFGPSGASFTTPVPITIGYNPANMPAGFSETGLVIAFYDTAASQWVTIPGSLVNTEGYNITVQVSHFTFFAVIAALPVTPVPTSKPAPTPTATSAPSPASPPAPSTPAPTVATTNAPPTTPSPVSSLIATVPPISASSSSTPATPAYNIPQYIIILTFVGVATIVVISLMVIRRRRD